MDDNSTWAAWIMLAVIIFFGLYVWAKDYFKKREARRKTKEAQTVDLIGIEWRASEAEIERKAEESRRITEEAG